MIEICDHVRDGHFDAVLTNLEHAVRDRRQTLALEGDGFKVGDHCKLTYQTRPNYLNTYGVQVVRAGEQRGTLIVKALAPGKGSRMFRVNVTSLEKVT